MPVFRCRFDYCLARAQAPVLFGGFNHLDGDAVLYASRGVAPFELGVDVHSLGVGEAVDAHHRRIANGVEYVVIYILNHTYISIGSGICSQ